MVEKIEGIIIDTRRYSDSRDIVTLFTRSRGRMACISAAGNSKSGLLRRARLQPLAVIEANININASREMQNLGSFSLLNVTPDIYFNPVKRAVTLFSADFLNHLLRASAPDENVYNLILGYIAYLEESKKSLANIHISFLASMLVATGIFPDFEGYRPDYYFDMTKGEFVPFRPRHNDWLFGQDAAVFTYIRELTLRNSHQLAIDSDTRTRLLRNLLHYYSVHFPGTSTLNSPDILTSLLH